MTQVRRTAALLLSLALVLGMALTGAAASSTATITLEQAKTAALTHAGVKAADATFFKAKLEYDDGRQVYDLEFYSTTTEYEYEIDAATGAVLSAERDLGRYTVPGKVPAGMITAAKAQEAALAHAKLKASEVTMLGAKLEYDDGRAEYDVKFYRGSTEYEYEIDAVAGTVLSFDNEIADFVIPGQTSTPAGLITPARAFELALAHAGVTSAEATLGKSKLDYENGRQVYELEFNTAAAEYDYDIDAATGAVVKFEREARPALATGQTAPVAGRAAGALLSADQARDVALAKAGVKVGDVTQLKVELDHDDGRAVYEVEFTVRRTEYEIKLDVATGAVLKWETDLDD